MRVDLGNHWKLADRGRYKVIQPRRQSNRTEFGALRRYPLGLHGRMKMDNAASWWKVANKGRMGRFWLFVALWVLAALLTKAWGQTTYGYTNRADCLDDAENAHTSWGASNTAYSETFGTEWALIVDGTYDYYRVADDPEKCFTISEALKNQVSWHSVVNVGAIAVITGSVPAGWAITTERLARAGIGIAGWGGWEVLDKKANHPFPTPLDIVVAIGDFNTEGQLSDPCSSWLFPGTMPTVMTTKVLEHCRDEVPITTGPSQRIQVQRPSEDPDHDDPIDDEDYWDGVNEYFENQPDREDEEGDEPWPEEE